MNPLTPSEQECWLNKEEDNSMKVAADSSETFGRKVKLGANVVFNHAVYVTGHHSFNFKPKSVERKIP